MGRQQHKKTQGFRHHKKIKAKKLLHLKKQKMTTKNNTLPTPLPLNTTRVIVPNFADVFGDPLLFNMGKSPVVIVGN